DKALNRWSASEVLVHEAALVRYLKRTWPNPQEVPDLRQEIYVRVYEAAQKSRPAFPMPPCWNPVHCPCRILPGTSLGEWANRFDRSKPSGSRATIRGAPCGTP